MHGIKTCGLTKDFFGIAVLKSVDLEINPGQILGLVGENGAGKSTLLNLLGGNLQASAGEMFLDGEKFSPSSPRESLKHGVGLVHQELNLFPNLSIAENLHLASFPTIGGIIKRRSMREATQRSLKRVGLKVSPDVRVALLSPGQQQLVEIARTLTLGARTLLLDEPTTSLSYRECETFYRLIHELAGEGHTIVLTTHAIGDVLEHCDRVVVLRDGELIWDKPTAEVSRDELVSQMVGRKFVQMYPHRDTVPRRMPLLKVDGLAYIQKLRDISFTVHEGEVLGMFGLMGSGRSQLARLLMGLDRNHNGSVYMNDRLLTGGPRRRIAQGMALVTENRRQDGICASSSVADNLSLVAIDRFARKLTGAIASKRLGDAIRYQRDRVMLQKRVKDEQAIKTLSGGNQQKVVIGKWLMEEPRLLILDEPTRGIDVGAKFEVYQLIHQLADADCGALVVSSDLEELLGICDRIVVMSLGRITGEFVHNRFDRSAIMAAALAQHDRPKEVLS